MTPDIQSGIYRHYKGKYYNVLGVGRHTETGELGVIYTPMYCHPAGGPALQFRPIAMWDEMVKGADGYIPRFVYVGQSLPPEAAR